MEKKRIVQYMVVLVMVATIFFVALVGYMTKLAFSTIKEVPQKVRVEQVVEDEEYEDSICECR